MSQTIRRFLLLEGISFVVAAFFHSGAVINGYEHREAAIAESVIAVVLLVGFGLSWVWPAWTRLIGIVAQAFALLGTSIGVFVIAIGVGPRTVPDIVYHIAIVIALIWGLVVAVRARPDSATQPA